MRILGLTIFLILFVWGQDQLLASTPKEKLEQFINKYSQVGGVSNTPDLSYFIKKLERKKIRKASPEFIHYLFIKTRKEFLRQYTEYTSFSETINSATYNCLTGTALYAILLDYFDIEYKIIETNYHIFLLASTSEGKILLEATDPINGYVDNAKDIESRIDQYKKNRIQEASADKKYYRYNFELYNEVSLHQMEGLLHFNLSIVAYNQQDLPSAIRHLDRALDLYNTPRITEFSSILLLSVMESNLDHATKADCLKRIQNLRSKQVPLMANRRFNH